MPKFYTKSSQFVLQKADERGKMNDFFYVMLSCITKCISFLIPKKKSRWVFGAWFGNSISDNPEAVYRYIKANHPEIETAWILRNPGQYGKEFRVFKRNSLKGLWYVMRSQVAVFNQGYMDFSTVHVLGGVKTIQLWHGVAWKKIGADARPEKVTRKEKLYYRAFDWISLYDKYIAPSELYAKHVISAFKTEENHILKVGQPRNEILFQEENCQELRQRLLENLGISTDTDQKLVVYMPTFRDTKASSFSFFDKEIFEKINNLAKELDFYILEKSHHAEKREKLSEKPGDRLVSCQKEHAEILLASADVLITDYSSCFFDFLIRDKPIIHFAYDYEYYRDQDRGLYYGIDEISAGDVVYDFKSLLDCLRKNLQYPETNARKREKIRKQFITYECVDNSRIIVEEICNR